MGAELDHDPAAVAAAMFERDRASQHLGIEVVSVEVGRAVLSMTVLPSMVNGLDVCHGGFLFTLADSAMAFASNATNERAFASHADIDFVNAAPLGTRLTATATTAVQRGKLMIHDVVVSDDQNVTIAAMRGRTLTVGGSVVA